MSMKDRVAIITGASRGIGRATARLFAQAGAHVVVFSRSAVQLEEVAGEIAHAGGSGLALAGDVSQAEDVNTLFARTSETYGRVDVLVNCAGIVAVRPFLAMYISTWDTGLALSFARPF